MSQSMKEGLCIFLKIGAIAMGGFVGLVAVGTFLNLVSYHNKLGGPYVLPIPSAESIGREYLQTVIQRNRDRIADDGTCVHGQLLQNIAQYGGAEVRNVSVVARWNSGNGDHQFEVTSIKFEHRYPTTSWKMDELQLMTATNLERKNVLQDALPFRKIFCGGS
jgi:hypothetical protein